MKLFSNFLFVAFLTPHILVDPPSHLTDTRTIRAGKGKMRNRRFQLRKGPLVIYSEDHGITHAFRNIPGVDLIKVDRLNLLQLAPGGHMGRFCIWTQAAFEKLDDIYGTFKKVSVQKSGYRSVWSHVCPPPPPHTLSASSSCPLSLGCLNPR